MSDRHTIFESIRKALEPLPEKTPYPEWDDDLTVSNHCRTSDSTVDLFKGRLQAAHGVVVEGWEALGTFLRQQEVKAGYMDESLMAEAGNAIDGLTLEHVIDRDRIDDYSFGITRASGAIAETGTIVIRDEDTPYRLAALAPWTHVAVVRRAAVFRTVAEAVAGLGDDPSIIFATGPSKTADIEGILIEGVHGPGCQVCCLV